MSLKCLGVFLLVNLVAAEIPSYFKTCKRRDPKVDQCVIDAVTALTGILREGIPELGVPSVDPVHLKFLNLVDSDSITVNVRDVVIVGLSHFDIESFHCDFEKQTFEFTPVFKHATFTAEYHVKAKIVVPMVERGHMRIDGEYIHTKARLNYEIIKKNGVEFLHLTSMTTKFSINNFKPEFKPLDNGNGVNVTSLIDMAVQGSGKEILEVIIPIIEKSISIEILKAGNIISMNLPFNEIFPDTE